jgi:hypothetical protein
VATIHLGRSSPTASCNQPGRRAGKRAPMRFRTSCRPYSVLLPVGFALPSALPRPRCALTAPFHPYHLRGGLLSVALSLGSPPPDVIRHRVSMEPGLSSPARMRGRPPGRLTSGMWRPQPPRVKRDVRDRGIILARARPDRVNPADDRGRPVLPGHIPGDVARPLPICGHAEVSGGTMQSNASAVGQGSRAYSRPAEIALTRAQYFAAWADIRVARCPPW